MDLDKYLDDCVKVVPEALEEEFVRVSADFAFWNDKYSNIYRYWNEMKFAREMIYAKLYREKESILTMGHKGRVTVGTIEAAIMDDPSYFEAKMKEITAEAEKVRLYGVLEAVRTKKDMLISIGAHQRMERANDPLIRHAQAVQAEVDRNRR